MTRFRRCRVEAYRTVLFAIDGSPYYNEWRCVNQTSSPIWTVRSLPTERNLTAPTENWYPGNTNAGPNKPGDDDAPWEKLPSKPPKINSSFLLSFAFFDKVNSQSRTLRGAFWESEHLQTKFMRLHYFLIHITKRRSEQQCPFLESSAICH